MARKAKEPEKPALDFETCGSCGGSHTAVAISTLASPKPPWTHYYICPKTQDPCMVTVIQRGSSFVEINRKIVESIIEAESQGSFIVAVFFSKQGRLQLHRHAFNFDVNRGAKQCSDLLLENMENAGKAPPRADLPQALPPKADPIFHQVIDGEAKPSS